MGQKVRSPPKSDRPEDRRKGSYRSAGDEGFDTSARAGGLARRGGEDSGRLGAYWSEVKEEGADEADAGDMNAQCAPPA